MTSTPSTQHTPQHTQVSVFLMMSSAETMKWKSAGWTRYSKYSKAKTIGEAFELGATRADIKYQVERGNMRLKAPNKATQKKYEADLEKKAGGDDGWREARVLHSAEGQERDLLRLRWRIVEDRIVECRRSSRRRQRLLSI